MWVVSLQVSFSCLYLIFAFLDAVTMVEKKWRAYGRKGWVQIL